MNYPPNSRLSMRFLTKFCVRSAPYPARPSRQIPMSSGYLSFIHCAVSDVIIGLQVLN